ncbi:MAG: tetratricopeptide repeat protein [Candidatus Spyradenecus sp.]
MAESMAELQRKIKAQQFLDKATKAAERGSLDIALPLCKQALALAPHDENARRQFHEVRIRLFKSEKKGGLGLKMAELGAQMKMGKVDGLIKQNKLEEAMVMAEELMDINPISPKLNEFYFDVAQRTNHPEALLSAMETLAAACPNDMDLMLRMGKTYMQSGIYNRARDCFQRVSQANPADLNVQKLLKDAMAKDTMTAGGWEANAGKRGGFQALIRDKELAAKLDRNAKAVVTGDDAEAAIAEAREKIAREPKNINYYRALARIFLQNKRFDEALEVFDGARKVNPADPELDRNWADTKVRAYEAQIDALKAQGKEDEAFALEEEKEQFRFDDLSRRVEAYPNDLGLRYELGVMYYQYEYYDEAISQFQLAQKSPKHRLEALYYLACCFKSKGQPDMAVMQLEAANSQLQVMDDLKKHVIYTLGQIAEEAGDNEKAFNYYKDVYAADIGFEDIGERMQRVHTAK